MALRPTTDELMADSDWYAFLTEAQDYWLRVIAAHAPSAVCSVPTAMTTADSGLTYTVSGVTDLVQVVEVTDGKGGRPLVSGAYSDAAAEYTWEGAGTIRMCRNVARTFSDGLYIRYVIVGGTIDGSTEPTLPTQFRLLLPPRACVLYATRGGVRDPMPYMREEQKIWSGEPSILGDVGIMGALKKRQSWNASYAKNAPWFRLTGDIG